MVSADTPLLSSRAYPRRGHDRDRSLIEDLSLVCQKQDSSSQRSSPLGQTSRNDPIKGFTLIELIVTMVILAILALVAVPKFIDLVQQAKIASTQAGLGAVRSALSVGMAERISNNQPAFPAVLTASDFATNEVPLNKLNNVRGVSAVASIPGGTATSASDGFWYIQDNGLAGAYSDGVVDTSGW